MGTITTGIGLVSGINTAQLIDQLMSLESAGKVRLQQRVGMLQAQRTALLDINARLLNLKNSAGAFRLNRVFQSSLATSSNEDVLTATAGTGAAPGSYLFIVRQLVSTSQVMSGGFADRNTTPMGMESISFEFGKGTLATDVALESLNGGSGVDRGKIVITDRSGANATIDLGDATTLNEVIERINSATGVAVTASVDGDRLVITDDSSGAGTLTIANGAGDTTATNLGIAGTGVGATLTGSVINTIGTNTALSSLNDGTGVLVRNNVPSLSITARDGTAFDVDFGRMDAPITGATELADLNNGLGVAIGEDGNDDLTIYDRDGNQYDISLNGVTTVQGLIDRVNNATSGRIAISITTGDRLTVTDTVGGPGNLRVTGAGENGDETAEDLGILNDTGVAADSFTGTLLPNTIDEAPADTIGEIITRINTAAGNDGRVLASLAADGVSLLITDTTGGGGNLIIDSTAGNPHAAMDLGIYTGAAGVASSTIDGERLIAGLGTVLTRNLNGGSGLGAATTMTLTDRSGASVTVNSLNTHETLDSLIDAINTAASGAGVDIVVGLNSAGNGLEVTDTSGGVGNLVVSGDAAEALGIDGNVAATSIRGGSAQHQYVSESTLLSDLNYGRGIGLGKFKITDGLGASATIDIGSDSKTVYDVIQEINSRGLAVVARINDTGDGILLEEDLEPGEVPTVKFKVEAVSGSTAKDLNILGSSTEISGGVINGSYERTVDLSISDNLEEVMKKINEAGIPVSASIVNAGSGVTPYRLNITSSISGARGELHIDSGAVDLGFSYISHGADAKVFFGAENADDGLLITSSSNTIKNVIDGVTLNLQDTSDEPVRLDVARDEAAVLAAVSKLVTTFNDVIGRINGYDFFDVESEQRGVLLGNSTTSRVRESMYRVLQQKAVGVSGQFQFLRDVGIRVGSDGQISLDEEKFRDAYTSDPEAVENLFASFEGSTSTTEEILPGVTVTRDQQNIETSGFGELFKALADDLTNTVNGVVKVAGDNFQDQIELMNRRITDFDARLGAKRTRLEMQFAAMEAALARLQGQNNALGSISSNVAMAQAMLLR